MQSLSLNDMELVSMSEFEIDQTEGGVIPAWVIIGAITVVCPLAGVAAAVGYIANKK